MQELAAFLRNLWRHWLMLMCGILALVYTFASLFFDSLPEWAPPWIFGTLGVLALLIACFLAWRDQYREAHPYDKERFQAARDKSASFTEEQWRAFERLAIDGSVPADQLPPTLEASAMIDRDFTTGHCTIKPAFVKIIPRLIKERRSVDGVPRN